MKCIKIARPLLIVRQFSNVASVALPSKENLESLHPKSIKLASLGASDRQPFASCRAAIYHNNYNLIAPMLENVQRHSPTVMACLLEALGKMGRIGEMESALKEWTENGGTPNEVIMEIVVDKLLQFNLVSKAQQVLSEFTEMGISSRISIHNSWINYFLRMNNMRMAKEVFGDLKKEHLAPNRITFSAFYKHFMRSNDFSAAEQTKAAMIAAKIAPNTTFYNMQLSSFLSKMMFKEVDKVIEEMRVKNVWMDESSFDILVAGYAQSGKKEEMEKWLWERGKEPKSKMSQRSYSRLIESLGMNMSAEQCKDYFVELQSTSGSTDKFNVFVYFSLATAFLEQQRYDEVAELFQEIQRMDMVMPEPFYIRLAKRCMAARFNYGLVFVRDELSRHGIAKSSNYYSLIVKYYLGKTQYDMVDEQLREMFENRIYPNDNLVSAIIRHLCDKAHIRKVQEIIQWLADHKQNHLLNISPSVNESLHLAQYVYCSKNIGGILRRQKEIRDRDTDSLNESGFDRNALDLNLVEERFKAAFPNVPFQPSVHTFNDILIQCLKYGRYDECQQVYNEMRRQSIFPNQYTFTYLLKGKLWLGQLEEARKLLYEIKSFGLRPTTFQFGLVHHSHCRLGLTTEAEQILREMTDVFHVLPNHVFYASLLFSHCRRFEYSAVFRIFEAMHKQGLKADTETSNYVLLSLFDVGEYAEAMQFFSKMCLEGIKRNTYTYTILADRMLSRDDVEGMLGMMSDALLDGNSMDAFPFLRILSYLHNKMAHPELEKVVDMMVELGIRLDTILEPFMLFVINRKLSRLETHPETVVSLRMLIEKCLIDMISESQEATAGQPKQEIQENLAIWEAQEKLCQHYKAASDHESLRSLELFTERLPEIRKLLLEGRVWKRVSADIFEWNPPSIADLLFRSRFSAPAVSLFN